MVSWWWIVIAKLLYRMIPTGHQLTIWRWPDPDDGCLTVIGGAEINKLLGIYGGPRKLLWKLGRGRITNR